MKKSTVGCSTSPLRARQRGYSLLEMSIVLSIGAGFLLAMTMAMHTHLLELRTKTMVQRYQALQSAAQRYLEAFGPLLIKLPAECADRLYRTGQALQPPAAISYGRCAQALDHEGRRATVTNALQPLAHELKALGMLDAQTSTQIIMDHQSAVLLPLPASTGAMAPPDLAVRIRRVCESPACLGPAVWESVVYNRQPFALTGGNWAFNALDQVDLLFKGLGSGAAMSEAGIQRGALVALRGEFTFENPVLDPSDQGLAGIVALRVTTHAWPSTTWARRDGQTPIAGPWNFDSHDLQGVAKFGAQSVQAKDLQLSGKAQVNEASAQMMDVNQLQVANLRVPLANRGTRCDPAAGNLALDSSDSRLLTCDAASLLWIRP